MKKVKIGKIKIEGINKSGRLTNVKDHLGSIYDKNKDLNMTKEEFILKFVTESTIFKKNKKTGEIETRITRKSIKDAIRSYERREALGEFAGKSLADIAPEDREAYLQALKDLKKVSGRPRDAKGRFTKSKPLNTDEIKLEDGCTYIGYGSDTYGNYEVLIENKTGRRLKHYYSPKGCLAIVYLD